MIYRAHYSTRGVIVIDILIALALAAVYVAMMSQVMVGTREIFYHARDRDDVLTEFQAREQEMLTHAAMKPYGNEMVQRDMAIGSSTETITFTGVHKSSDTPVDGVSGTSWCSVDLVNRDVVGSYSFLQRQYSTSTYPAPETLQFAVSPIVLPISSTIPLTYLEIRGHVAYISTDSNVAADPDLFIIDISTSTQPTVRSSINTGPGIASFSIAGSRIFAAAASSAAQLHVIKINDLEHMALEKKYQLPLPLPYATATPPFGTAISFLQNKVYVGTEKWDGDEFSVVDVSNPSAPTKIGGLEIGGKVNDIYTIGGMAYIASADQAQIRSVNVKNPSVPMSVSSVNPSGWQR
jgi:LVIVD repeat